MTTPLATDRPVRRLGDCKAVAAMLGMSWRTVLRLADAGKIPPGVKLGSLRRWDLSEIDRFIGDGCRPPRTTARGTRS